MAVEEHMTDDWMLEIHHQKYPKEDREKEKNDRREDEE